MASRRTARATTRRIRIRKIRIAGVLLVISALVAAPGYQLLASSSPTAASPTSPVAVPRTEPRVAVLDDGDPGVANLDPALFDAVDRAAADAARDGVEFVVDSGWRSPEYQQQLLNDAVLKYGSEAEAARWVATPSASPHVSGDAADIGPSGAEAWLSAHGAQYGLCQIYSNEPWHYELRPEAVDRGCPAMYADPTHDPRMQP